MISREAQRLAVLQDHQILDTAPEEQFDDLVRLAAQVCGAPIAAVSLIDDHRQWFKAITGLDVTETPRDAAFCGHTIRQSDLLVVPDATQDARFADNMLVTGDPNIRFYAGLPLTTSEGHALGSLCVIDTVPRTLTPEQVETLRLLARQASSHLRASRQIAERERMLREKECLAAEKEHLVAIIASSEDAIYSKTLDGTITSWNTGAAVMYGFTASEIIGQRVDILVPSDRSDEFAFIMAAVRRGERISPLETVRVTKAGRRVEVALRVSPMKDADGNVIGASMVARDITERRRVEAALEAEREFTQAMLESLQEGIVACDGDGTLTLFNRATRDFHGLPERPLPPEQWADHFDLYESDGLTPLRTRDIPLYRALQGEVVRDAEMVIAPRCGRGRAILASGRPILGADGRRLGAVVAMHDMTERKQIEREMSRLAAIVESSQDAMMSSTLDGSIVSWNQAAERLYGYAACEVIGRSAAFLTGPGQESPVPAVNARLIRGESVEAIEVIRMRRDGTTFDALLTFSPIINERGAVVGQSCIARDITARKETERALVRSQARLVEAQRIGGIGDFDLDVATGRVTWSAEMYRLLEFDPAQGEPSLDAVRARILPEDRAIRDRLFAHALDTGESFSCDLRMQLPSGTPRSLHLVGNAASNADGTVTRVTGVMLDITERKTLEAELQDRAERLRQSEAGLRALLGGAPVILYATDADGKVTLSEGTGLSALGLRPGEVVGRSVFDFSDGDAEIEAKTRRALAGETISFDARIGGLSLHTELRPVSNVDGSPGGLIGVCFDVTERALAEERFRVLFEQSSDAHLLLGEGGMIDCNAATVALLGCQDKAQVLGLHPAVMSPEFQPDGSLSREKKQEMDALARENGHHRFEWVMRKTDGEDFPVEVSLTTVTLVGGPVLLAVIHDLTERKRAEEKLQDYAVILEHQKGELERANAELAALATSDGLTGLKNHRAFQERLAVEAGLAARHGEPLSLVILDVDRFKQYNDAHGHPAGDAVLRAVAHALQDGVRETDLAARYGGEEFVLLLPQTDLDGAVVVAERARKALEGRPWPLRSVTASFGVATLRQGESGADLIARADAAMYDSKVTGRNRVTRGGTSPPACGGR